MAGRLAQTMEAQLRAALAFASIIEARAEPGSVEPALCDATELDVVVLGGSGTRFPTK